MGETLAGAIAVVKKGITAHGVPERPLSDNGAALNPSHHGARPEGWRVGHRLWRSATSGDPMVGSTNAHRDITAIVLVPRQRPSNRIDVGQPHDIHPIEYRFITTRQL